MTREEVARLVERALVHAGRDVRFPQLAEATTTQFVVLGTEEAGVVVQFKDGTRWDVTVKEGPRVLTPEAETR